jgi:Protein of unknown function (DUF3703)
MKAELKAAYDAELHKAAAAQRNGALDQAFAHLERAHILGQRYLVPHLATHWRMLQIARARRDRRETRGQIARLLAVFLGYVTGWVPKGNTGGANVPAIKPMPPPADLAPLLADYNVSRDVMVRAIGLGSVVALANALSAGVRP